MRVYLVVQRIMELDRDDITIRKIFDSEEKAKRYIKTTFASYDYSEISETWAYRDIYDITEIWVEEWEVQ